MYKYTLESFANQLSKYFYPLSIASIVVVLFVVWTSFPRRFTVFGLYGLFGFLGGAFIYYYVNDSKASADYTIDDRRHHLGVYSISTVTVGAIVLTAEPRLVFIGLLIGYTLVVRQLLAEPRPRRLISQLVVLFLLSPVTKYVTAGRYIGDGDTIIHTGFIEQILHDNTLAAIASESYYEFPGLHLAATTVGSISGLGAYDSLLVIGIGSYAILIPVIYVITFRFTNNDVLALTTAFGVVVLDNLSFYASYVFPQSVAMILILILIMLVGMSSRDTILWRVVAVFGVVTTALAFTHHLTQLLFLPVIVCVGLLYAIHNPKQLATQLNRRHLGLFGLFTVINGTQLWVTGFFDRIYRAAEQMVLGGLFGGYTRSVSLAFGETQQSDSVLVALNWLFGLHGLYLILLVTMFSVGVVWTLRGPWNPAIWVVALTGITGSVLILETPISIRSLGRISAPWLFPFAFVLGISIYQLRKNVSSAGQRRLLMGLLVILAATTPMVTIDNYYETDPRPMTETSFSEQEYAELQATASFVESREESTTVFWNTRLIFNRYQIDELQRSSVQEETLHIPPGYLVYRSAWADHTVSFTAGTGDSLYSNRLEASDRWLSDNLETKNKVYTTGEIDITWAPIERRFDDTEPTTPRSTPALD